MDLEETTRPQRGYYLSVGKLAAMIVGTSAATALAIVLWLLRINDAFDPDPALVRSAGLGTGNVDEISNNFDMAVRNQFPLGSKEADLISELIKEKFKPDWGGRRATYRGIPGVCVNEYSVSWVIDSDDRLTRVSGSFQAICL